MLQHTDWLYGFIGGTFIGLSASLMLLLQGRITGISGIASGLLNRNADSVWKWFFIIGLALGVVVYSMLLGGPPKVVVNHSIPLLITAGILVGLGTRIGNGCTSGHGICGIARLSKRSIVATTVFMITAVLTVWLVKLVN